MVWEEGPRWDVVQVRAIALSVVGIAYLASFLDFWAAFDGQGGMFLLTGAAALVAAQMVTRKFLTRTKRTDRPRRPTFRW